MRPLPKKRLNAVFSKFSDNVKWVDLMTNSNNKPVSHKFKRQGREMRSYCTTLEMAETW